MHERRLIFCPACASMASVLFHICNIYKEGVLVRTSHKKWDSRLNCWVLDDNKTVMQKLREDQKREEEDVRKGNRYYDSRQGKWVDLEDRWVKGTEGDPGDEQARAEEKEGDGSGYQSCEIPRKEPHPTLCVCDDCKPYHTRSHPESCSCWNCWSWKKAKGLTDKPWHSYGSTYEPYIEVKPWDGVEQAKWPTTFKFLMGQYFIHGRWSEGLNIPNKEFRDRVLNNKYAPEPKPLYKKKYTDEDASTEFWRHWGDYGES